MMADLKKGKINLILIADLSRLSCNIHDFSNLLNDLDRFKAKFLSIKEQFDTSTPAGKMMIFNLINLAQFEREQVSERVSLGVHARAMRGLLNGGRAILGYDKHPEKPGVYVLNRDEADQVRTIFKTFLQTGSRAKTIQQLEILGIRPKMNTNSGKVTQDVKWSAQSLGNLLNSATYLGHHEVNRRNKKEDQQLLKPLERYQIVKAAWPAIIDEKTFSQAQRLLEEAKELERTRLKDAESRVYILSGLLRCGTCGGPLVSKTSHGSKSIHRYYGHTVAGTKNGCQIQRVSADAIEKAILDHLKAGLAQAGYFKRIGEALAESRKRLGVDHARESRRVKQRLSELETQTASMFMMQGQQSMGADALRLLSEAIEKIAKETRTLTEYLEQVSRQGDSCGPVGESVQLIQERLGEFARGFAKATGTQKRRLLRRAIKQLVLRKDGISIFFHLADDDETSGHKLQLVRDESGECGNSGGFYLSKGQSEGVSKLSVLCSSIRKNGDPELQSCNLS